MLNNLPVIFAVGTALGFLSGLGIGGGSLLILWLTMILDMEPAAARNINLLFFLPASVVSCFFRWRQGSLPLRKVTPGIICGCIAAVIFSEIAARFDAGMLQKLFAFLLLFTGLREIMYKPK